MTDPFALLAQVPLFRTLPARELRSMASTLPLVDLSAGMLLFSAGEHGDSFYVVRDGELEIIQAPGTPEEHVIARRGPGEFVGEMSLLNPTDRRTASVRAREHTTLWRMTQKEFTTLITRHPGLAYDLARVLSERMTAAQQVTIDDLRAKNRELQQAYRDLEAAQAQLVEKEKLERELQLACNIQMSVLPKQLPELPGFALGTRIAPARTVGGDFYDVMQMGSDRVGIAVGDVAGKGMPAALFMTQVHALLHAAAEPDVSPADALRWVNRQLFSRGAPALFATVLYGVLDVARGEFSYARAGHETPVIISPGRAPHSLPWGVGMALGFVPEPPIDQQVVAISPGSSLLLYTDGATDVQNVEKELFGAERLLASLSPLTGAGAQPLCDRLFETLTDYRGSEPAFDDVTLVAIEAIRS